MKSFVGALAAQRAVVLCALASLFIMGSLASVSAETRTLRMYYTHTKESITVTYKKNGRYVKSGLKKLNRFLRDFRRNEPTRMDPKLFDVVWEVYRKSGSRKPIHVISGYRSPRTNKMLRRRGRKVAKTSQHMRGKALDFFMPDVPVTKLRALGLKAHAGGVGYYRGSFVHLDTGRVRHWPRMSRRQLSRVFPRGRTLHRPSDGRPMKRHKVALANLKRGLNYDGSRRGSGGGRSVLAKIFNPKANGGGDEKESAAALAKVKAKPKPKPKKKKPEAKPVAVAARKPAPAVKKPTGPDPFALEVAQTKKAAEDAKAAKQLAVATQAALEARTQAEAEAAGTVTLAQLQVPVPRRRPQPKALQQEPAIQIAQADTSDLIARTQLAFASRNTTATIRRPSVDVPSVAAFVPQDDKALSDLKSRIQTALARQQELSAVERAVEAQANTELANKIARLPVPAIAPQRFDQPAVQVALKLPEQPQRVSIPKRAERKPVVAAINKDAVEKARIPVPKAVPEVQKPKAVASVKPKPKPKTVATMNGELALGDLDGASVKAWAIATSTRVGPIAALTAPAYRKSTKRAAPASVYTAGFANDRPPLRSDRFTGRALKRVVFASLRLQR